MELLLKKRKDKSINDLKKRKNNFSFLDGTLPQNSFWKLIDRAPKEKKKQFFFPGWYIASKQFLEAY